MQAQMVRSLTPLATHAAGIQAIEVLYVDLDDNNGSHASSRASYAEELTGRIAIHPSPVAVISGSHLPSPQKVAQARRAVAADGSHGAGTASHDGKMKNIPHPKPANGILVKSTLNNRSTKSGNR